MTWTYIDTLATNRDRIRFLIGDTDTNNQLLSDDEIVWVVTQEENVYGAAATACRAIAGKLAREISRSSEGFSKSLSDQYRHYTELAETLDAKRGMTYAIPSFPAGSIDSKDALVEDTDIPRYDFKRGMNDIELPKRNQETED